MDFVRPVQAVILGAQGRILAVLAETTAGLNLRTVARLAAVSTAQASRLLPTLVELGILERREVPPSALFRFVAENVAARAISALTNARRTVLDEVGQAAGELEPPPACVIVFGSFGHGEAEAESDLDLVVVRASNVGEDNEGWRESVDLLRVRAQTLTGNRVEIVETDTTKVRALLRARKPLWQDVRRDGIVVFGTTLADLTGRRSG